MSIPDNSNSFDVLIGTKRRNTDSSKDETIVISSSYSDFSLPPPHQQTAGTNEGNERTERDLNDRKPPPRVISRTVRRGSKKSNNGRRKKRSASGFSFDEEALISNLIDGVKADPPNFHKAKKSRSRLKQPMKSSKDQSFQTPHQPTRKKPSSHNSGPFPLTIHSQGSASSSGSGMSLISSSRKKENYGSKENAVLRKGSNNPLMDGGNAVTSNPLKRKRVHPEKIESIQPPTKKLRRTSPPLNENDVVQRPPPRYFPFSARNRMISENNSNNNNNNNNNNPLHSSKKESNSKYITVNSKVYWKLGVVGRGGSSKVFKCICEDSNEIVAIKRVRLIGPPHIIRSFLNEVEILKNLQGSSHIIRLYDSEAKDGELFLVMECGEVDLNNVLRRQRNQPLNLNLVRLYWEQMLEAVFAIHEKRIVHGDLKPANFLLVRGAIKLIDFGIAKAIQHDNTTNIVREAQVGTLNYISPEALQIHHEEYDEDEDDEDEDEGGGRPRPTKREGRPRYKVGRSSDIWSLGCILSQMVTGHAPFAHYPMFQKIQAIVDDDVKIVVPKHVPRDVANIVKMTLRRDPRKRPTIPELLNHQFLKPNFGSSSYLTTPLVTTDSSSSSNNSKKKMICRRDAALLLNRNSQVLFSSKYGRKEKEFFCSEMIRRVQDEKLSCMDIMNIPIQKKKE